MKKNYISFLNTSRRFQNSLFGSHRIISAEKDSALVSVYCSYTPSSRLILFSSKLCNRATKKSFETVSSKKRLFIITGIGIIIAAGIILKNRVTATPIKVAENDIIFGDPRAPITLIEYSDYQCVFCKRFFENSLPRIKDEFIATGKVRFIYRDFVFYGQESFWAAHATRCANEQGKFWEYHDLLFKKQKTIGSGAFNKENHTTFARELGLSLPIFDVCMNEARYRKQIDASKQEATTRGVWGTPSFFVNDFGPIFGSHNYYVFKSFIEGALANTP